MQLRIAYLYPDIMNIYGDRGNIIALTQRCHWRGVGVKVDKISLGDPFNWQKYDLFFSGGGQDRQQELVSKDLKKKASKIRQAVEQGKVFLLICGTYQLFGHYFKNYQGKKIPGIGVLDMVTIASPQRKIGNALVKLTPEIKAQLNPNQQIPEVTLIGFENHSGNTTITQRGSQKRGQYQTVPLAKVIKGFGNNGHDKTEGAAYHNVFGTYLHGSLLPKNPHFTDMLIKKALENRYQKKVRLKPLDDSLEWQAHRQVTDLIK